ncbi:hypothetical protein SLA2020_434410 [Shorea laevis]
MDDHQHGWNVRPRNMHGSTNHARHQHDHQQPFYNPTQIACRICDHVFMSTQALINHIESHMVEEETAASIRQHRTNRLPASQRDLFANCLQPSFATLPENGLPPPPLPERHPFLALIGLLLRRQLAYYHHKFLKWQGIIPTSQIHRS